MKHFRLWQRFPDDVVYGQLESPVGMLTIFASSKGVHRLIWQHEAESVVGKEALAELTRNDQHSIMLRVKQQLQEYFSGQRKVFNVPVCFTGTDFQIQVWQALQTIPYGETISYGEQARRLGDQRKARAVGMANGANPVSIIVPCHRVIGSNGKLTGFGGGLDKKAWLLQLEQDN